MKNNLITVSLIYNLRVKFLGVLNSLESWSPHTSKLDKI